MFNNKNQKSSDETKRTNMACYTFNKYYQNQIYAMDTLQEEIHKLKNIQMTIPLCPNKESLEEVTQKESAAKLNILCAMNDYDKAKQEFNDALDAHPELANYYQRRPFRQTACDWLIYYSSNA